MNNQKSQNQSKETPGKKLTVPQIIDFCKNELGITFNLMDEQKAAEFLAKNNYFFRLKQYAEIATEKTKKGKYIGIDFGQLVELSTIDMFFRKLMLKMTIDFEHNLKVKLVNECQTNPADDGYLVVKEFFEQNPKIREAFVSGVKSIATFYNKQAFDKYNGHYSVWSIIEMLPFSSFIDFYQFYYNFFNLKCEYTKHFDSIRRLRNAAAHNACLLCSFKPVSNFPSDLETIFELLQANIGLSNGLITNLMKVPVINDFVVMLSTYTKLITSERVKKYTFDELIDFFDNRMLLRKGYFDGNSEVKNAYQFTRRVLEYYSQI